MSNRAMTAIEKADRIEDQLLDTLELMGASDDLLTVWASAEANALDSQKPPHGLGGAGGIGSPLAIPDRARRACLQGMCGLTQPCGLSMEAWFDAAMLFDSYVCKAGSRATVAELPLLCAALLRMLCKEERMDPEMIDWSGVSCQVAQGLAIAGYASAMARVVPAGQQDLALAEMQLLKTLQWRVNVPNTAKWLTVYFNRLQAFAPALEHHRVAAAWQSAVHQASAITMLQPPSVEFPPQRLARAVLIFTCVRFGMAVLPEQSAPIQGFEAVTGCLAAELRGDCDLARRLTLRMGTRHTAEI